MNIALITDIVYVVAYIGCLVGQHFGWLPAGSENVVIGIIAGHGVSTLAPNSTPTTPTPSTSIKPSDSVRG